MVTSEEAWEMGIGFPGANAGGESRACRELQIILLEWTGCWWCAGRE